MEERFTSPYSLPCRA